MAGWWRVALALSLVLMCLSTAVEALGAQVATPDAAAPQDPAPQARGVNQVDTPEARELAARYTPILMVRRRPSICSSTGEPYLPVPVDLVFDNPAVKLRRNSGHDAIRDPLLLESPLLADLAGADADTYLDFPGRPRSPGCTYERWYRAYMADYEPTAYARVVESDPGHVVVQYHLFYVFNDFNNNHESDWEMVQLRFDVPTVAGALEAEPVEVAYGQHAGGETAGWESGTLDREGSHIVAYVSQGSHASHFGSDVYLGWGEKGSGFGCDTTLGPHRRVEVDTVLLAAPPLEPGASQSWVDWRGRWGERQEWQYDGPVGPRRTKRWTDPVGWQERLRDSSLTVPGTTVLGPAPADVFCNVTRYGSLALMRLVGEPWYFVAVLVIPVAIVGALVYISWSTLLAATRVYLRYLPVFMALGLLLIPIGILANRVYDLAIRYTPAGDALRLMEYTPVSYYVAALPIASLQQVLSLLVVVPAVLEIYQAIERGERITLRRMLDGVHEHFRPMLRAIAKPIGKVVLAQLSVIGLPWAIERSVRWGFVAHAVVLDDTPPPEAPVRSAGAVRGRWWRTAATLLVLAFAGSAPGPLLGITLMVTQSRALVDVNALSSLMYAVLLPFSILGSAILYRQRQGRVLPESASVPMTAQTPEPDGRQRTA